MAAPVVAEVRDVAEAIALPTAKYGFGAPKAEAGKAADF